MNLSICNGQSQLEWDGQKKKIEKKEEKKDENPNSVLKNIAVIDRENRPKTTHGHLVHHCRRERERKRIKDVKKGNRFWRICFGLSFRTRMNRRAENEKLWFTAQKKRAGEILELKEEEKEDKECRRQLTRMPFRGKKNREWRIKNGLDREEHTGELQQKSNRHRI